MLNLQENNEARLDEISSFTHKVISKVIDMDEDLQLFYKPKDADALDSHIERIDEVIVQSLRKKLS